MFRNFSGQNSLRFAEYSFTHPQPHPTTPTSPCFLLHSLTPSLTHATHPLPPSLPPSLTHLLTRTLAHSHALICVRAHAAFTHPIPLCFFILCGVLHMRHNAFVLSTFLRCSYFMPPPRGPASTLASHCRRWLSRGPPAVS